VCHLRCGWAAAFVQPAVLLIPVTGHTAIFYALLTAILAAGLLACAALSNWAREGRRELPLWRNAASLVSILAILVASCWLSSAILLLRIGNVKLSNEAVTPAIVPTLLGAACAPFLKGKTRVQTLCAGLLLVSFWYLALDF